MTRQFFNYAPCENDNYIRGEMNSVNFVTNCRHLQYNGKDTILNQYIYIQIHLYTNVHYKLNL